MVLIIKFWYHSKISSKITTYNCPKFKFKWTFQIGYLAAVYWPAGGVIISTVRISGSKQEKKKLKPKTYITSGADLGLGVEMTCGFLK